MSESNNENKLTDFNISQSYILSQREPEQAIYVPMTYWNFMKKKLTNMKTSWHIIDKIGGVLLGTGITTLLTLFIGKYQNPTNESWLLAVLFIFLGIACMIIDSEEADKTLNNSKIVLEQMDLIDGQNNGQTDNIVNTYPNDKDNNNNDETT